MSWYQLVSGCKESELLVGVRVIKWVIRCIDYKKYIPSLSENGSLGYHM